MNLEKKKKKYIFSTDSWNLRCRSYIFSYKKEGTKVFMSRYNLEIIKDCTKDKERKFYEVRVYNIS